MPSAYSEFVEYETEAWHNVVDLYYKIETVKPTDKTIWNTVENHLLHGAEFSNQIRSAARRQIPIRQKA